MERRAVLAAVLSLIVFMVWQYFFMPPPPLPLDTAPVAATAVGGAPQPGSPASEQGAAGNLTSSTNREVASVTPTAGAASSSVAVDASKPSAVSASGEDAAGEARVEPQLPAQDKEIHGKLFDATFTTEGGGLKSWKLKGYTTYHKGEGVLDNIKALFMGGPKRPIQQPMELVQGPFPNALPFRLDDKLADNARYAIISSSSTEISFQRLEGSLIITKRFQVDPNDYLMKLDVTLQNAGTASVTGRPGIAILERHVEAEGRYAPNPVPTYFIDGKAKTVSMDDVKTTSVQQKGVISWAGINDKYFLRAIVLPGSQPAEVSISSKADILSTEISRGALTLSPNQQVSLNYGIFLGPKISEVLEAHDPNLKKALDYGWLAPFAEPLLWLLKKLHGAVASWGLAIILLTLIIKTLFYPLMAKQMESAQRMKEFQPEMNALKEKYKDDKNKMNQEMMRFMQEKKLNPLGGCLPMLLQMPIWFALYSVLQSSIELYHTPFLYLPDLSEQDPFGVSPAILGALMFIQQKMTPPAPGMDPAQARMMQYMPLIFAFIMFSLPSGLVVYILVNTVLTIAQQWFITRKYTNAATVKAGVADRR